MCQRDGGARTGARHRETGFGSIERKTGSQNYSEVEWVVLTLRRQEEARQMGAGHRRKDPTPRSY